PMQATKRQLKNIKESEGVIIGSVLIDKEKELPWSQPYTLTMNQLIKSLYLTTYNLNVTQGEEKTFIKNLPAGDYEINTVTIHSIFFFLGVPHKEASPKVYLSVKANKTTYVGKLVITFHGNQYYINVEDDQTNTIESLKEEYSDLISTVDKNLMVLGLQHYTRDNILSKDWRPCDAGLRIMPLKVPDFSTIKFPDFSP
ncbi:MAG: hypothetical protein ACFFCW_37230, partial [Candidatus Hodarchaeota archaeon]